MYVKPKKHLGQHFLRNDEICERIAQSLTGHGGYTQLLEIGPGTGALTKYLLRTPYQVDVVEVDSESVAYLTIHYKELHGKIIEKDFLTLPLEQMYAGPVAIIGNFPYNISSQILFRALDYKDQVTELVGMFQKEVAERVASTPGGKEYGILSVLLQAWYDIEYLFTVSELEFDPPPKVKSGVIRLRRKENKTLDCDEKKFKQLIKLAFNQRRKTLRNSLKSLSHSPDQMTAEIFNRRPETLSVDEFVYLTNHFFPR
jgi:16S rRNA (adenine1518-N6/adenine1519-N6)-dimethyltransferase